MKYRARAAMHTVRSAANGKKRQIRRALSDLRRDTISLCLYLSIAVNQYGTTGVRGDWREAATFARKNKMAFVRLCVVLLHAPLVHSCCCSYMSVCFSACLSGRLPCGPPLTVILSDIRPKLDLIRTKVAVIPSTSLCLPPYGSPPR